MIYLVNNGEYMDKVIDIACATDDGINFTREHFGSAKLYLIFRLNLENKKIEFIKKLANISSPEEMHGYPKKAKSVSHMLRDIQALIGFAFGPNITRIRKQFIPIISRDINIKNALKKLISKIDEIQKDIKTSEDKEKKIIYIE